MPDRWDDLFDRATAYDVRLETVTDRWRQVQDTAPAADTPDSGDSRSRSDAEDGDGDD